MKTNQILKESKLTRSDLVPRVMTPDHYHKMYYGHNELSLKKLNEIAEEMEYCLELDGMPLKKFIEVQMNDKSVNYRKKQHWRTLIPKLSSVEAALKRDVVLKFVKV